MLPGALQDIPPVTFLLNRKERKRYNVLIGEDAFQVAFAEQALGEECARPARIDDETLLAEGMGLACVASTRMVDLSEGLGKKTSLWRIGPIAKGSPGALAIAKYAASALGIAPENKDALQGAADSLAVEGIGDMRCAIWKAAWFLLGPVPLPPGKWLSPWEDARAWLDADTDPSYRLNSLYRDLVAYAFLVSGEGESLGKLDISMSPSKLRYLRSLRLDFRKAYLTVMELSSWRAKKSSPYVCALKISLLWQR